MQKNRVAYFSMSIIISFSFSETVLSVPFLPYKNFGGSLRDKG